MLQKNQTQFQRRGFLSAIASLKRLLFGRACGLATARKVNTSLRAAYAELTRNLTMVLFNYDNYGEKKN